ncbi:hypothetical protein V6C03_02540 [Methyloligella sp. 2.7D]|uniref:hypothetical protein n=1 Tax=unclassified Methyloligella TaxID=2625955 RepID=UPI00157DE3D2|nr:hypothetical protein [Methyloligella sp. GL2]QKP76495.1 hypothetical protein HT051_02880 [Methyloligella sp. GL2]
MKWLLIGGVVLVGLCSAWVMFVLYMSRGACVVLPNGYLLGYAMIIPSNAYASDDMILRDPAGKIIVRTDYDILLERVPGKPNQVKVISRGGKMEMDGSVMMPLVWNESAFGHDRRKWNEPRGEAPGSLSIFYTSFWDVYLALLPSPNIKKVSCGTPWFDWGE